MSGMTQRQILDDLHEKHEKLYLAIVGDDKMGIKGLVQRQLADEKHQVVVDEKLQTIISNQEKQIDINSDVQSRLTAMEEFYLLFKVLSSIKRKSLIIVGSIIAVFGSLIAFWKDFKQFIHIP